MKNRWRRLAQIPALAVVLATLLGVDCFGDTRPVKILIRYTVMLQEGGSVNPLGERVVVNMTAWPVSRDDKRIRSGGAQNENAMSNDEGVVEWGPYTINLKVTASKTDPTFTEGIRVLGIVRWAGYDGTGTAYDWPGDPDSDLTRVIEVPIILAASE